MKLAKYTTEVRTICEFYANQKTPKPSSFASVDSTIQAAIPNIFTFTFPIFDESYRVPLETKILRHYYTREIGLETVGLWRMKLETKLNEVMPYFNQLYKSELLEFNPFYDVELGTTRNNEHKQIENATENADATSKSETDTTQTTKDTIADTDNTTIDSTVTRNNTEKNAYSDTPQGQVSNVDNYTYLTNYRNVNNTGTDSTDETNNRTYNRKADGTLTGNITNNSSSTNEVQNNKNITSTDDYIEKVSGKRGTSSYSSMLKEFRETFLNIDMQVIDSLSDLFMGVW